MKKVLIGLFSVLSLSALADGYNVYVKGGVNVLGQPNLGIVELKEKPFIKGYNLSLEATKDINKNLEVGLGIAYKTNKAAVYDIDKVAKKTENVEKQLRGEQSLGEKEVLASILPAGLKSIQGAGNHGKNIIDFSYNSIPVYLTAKMNLGDDNNFKPYIKADLGYSFNILKNPQIDYVADNKSKNKEIPSKEIENELKNFGFDESKDQLKVSNSLYLAGAIGAEYNNFIGEISASYTPAKILGLDYSNFTVGANIGYKFNF